MKAYDGKNITLQKQGKKVTKVNVIFLILASPLKPSSGCLGVSRKSQFRTRSGIFEIVVQCSKRCTMKCL